MSIIDDVNAARLVLDPPVDSADYWRVDLSTSFDGEDWHTVNRTSGPRAGHCARNCYNAVIAQRVRLVHVRRGQDRVIEYRASTDPWA